MKIVIDATNVIQGIGAADFVAPDGGTVLETARTLEDYAAADAQGKAAGSPYRLVYDRTNDAIVVQVRTLTASETEDGQRTAALGQLDTAITSWSTLTAAQKDAAMLLCLRVVRFLARYLMRQAAQG